MDADACLEVKCIVCGLVRFEHPRDLILKARLGNSRLDEVEQALSCLSRPRFERRTNGAPMDSRTRVLKPGETCRGAVTVQIIASQALRSAAGQ